MYFSYAQLHRKIHELEEILHNHHLIFRNVKDDKEAILIILCPNCHRKLHKLLDDMQVALSLRFFRLFDKEIDGIVEEWKRLNHVALEPYKSV